MDIKKTNTYEKSDQDMEISKRLQEVQGYWTRQYQNMQEDLRFGSGDQWSLKARALRYDKPVLTMDFTSGIINRVVNPVRKNPFGMRVKHNDKAMNELYQGLIRDIEYKSNASEAFETAFENAVTTGIGYFIVNTSYEDTETLNQTISIERISDPTSIYIDPNCEKIDGSDMKYAFRIKYIDKDEANRMYDLENDTEHLSNYTGLYKEWVVPENSIPEMIYYSIESDTVKRTWMKDGTFIDGEVDGSIPEEAIAGQRDIEKKYILVYKYVGGKKVEETRLETEYIPVVPVFGNPIFEDSWRGWGGIVKLVRDSQSMINYYASSEAQLIQSAPVSPWLIEEGQLEGYEDVWSTANTDAHDHLPYKAVSLGDKPAPPPQRVDNTAQTTHLTNARSSAIADMQRSTGIFDSQMGQEDIAGQSGIAIARKDQNASITSYHYIDNLMKSITQCGRITLDLINSIYDVERKLSVRGEDGSILEINGNVKESGRPSAEFDTEVEAGPMLQNEKDMTNAMLMEVGRLMPEKFGLFADILVANLGAPGSGEVVERLKKTLPPELLQEEDGGGEAPSPQAIAALQSADQNMAQMQAMLEEYEGIIENLQTQILDNENDRKAKIEAEQIKAETDIVVTEMNNETKIAVERIKAGSKANADNKKIAADARKNILSMVDKSMNDIPGSVSDVVSVNAEGAMDQTAKPGGPVAFTEGSELESEGDTVVQSIDDLLE